MVKQWVCIPDLGGVDEVTVLDVLIQPGAQVQLDQPICTLESDKASMEVPASVAGKVVQVALSVGQKVQEGSQAYEVELEADELATASETVSETATAAAQAPVKPTETVAVVAATKPGLYAGPGVRRLAHALGIALDSIHGTGPKGRVLRDDLYRHIKQAMHSGAGIEPLPKEDPYKYGDVSVQALSKIKQATAVHMRRCWQNIPHVTQHERVDITELEQFRQLCKPVLKEQGVRLTMLAFILKALVDVMQDFPFINALYNEQEQTLLCKQYYHIGVAVDTPGGLLVPVLRDVDRLSVSDIAKGLQDLSEKARQGSITPAELQGGGFTVTSLGGIGGDYFTPIVNGPQVAILGVSKAQIMPHWQGEGFEPRLLLPLSLSYDHRVVDGAQAARFIVALGAKLTSMQEQTLTMGLGATGQSSS